MHIFHKTIPVIKKKKEIQKRCVDYKQKLVKTDRLSSDPPTEGIRQDKLIHQSLIDEKVNLKGGKKKV